jgi:hypothetical protein
MCEKYDGWTNRETWAAALWINNDRGLYETVQELAKHADYCDSPLMCLEESLEALFDDAFSDIAEMTATGLVMLKDIGSLYRVNWREIATNTLQELQVQA